MKWKTKRILESGKIYLSYNVFGSFESFADHYGGTLTSSLIHQIIGIAVEFGVDILSDDLLHSRDLPCNLKERFLINVQKGDNYSINVGVWDRSLIHRGDKGSVSKVAVICYSFSEDEVENKKNIRIRENLPIL